MPAELDELTRRVTRLEIEEAALSKETDPASTARLDQLHRELGDLRAELDAKHAQWESERQGIRRVQELRAELEQVRHEAEEASAATTSTAPRNCATAASPNSSGASRRRKNNWRPTELSRLLREVVTEDEIADIVAAWTGIPVSRLKEGEREKLLRLDEILHQRVIGQDEAVRLVSDAIIRARSGIKDPRRPIGSFIFLGPTGVGKTELAKTLAATLFDSQDNVVAWT
jgi:ATP-dependent Clp protease ATP-binding subunit ClpB